MTLDELLVREQANSLHEVDKQEILTNFAFVNALVQGSDKDGKPLVKKPQDIANYDRMRKQITGEWGDDVIKVNKYKVLSKKAEKAREQAIKELEERRKTNG